MKAKIFVAFFLLILFKTQVFSQAWVESKDKNNFFETQRLFNEYWKNRPYERGKGYKQFKRWEWFWQNRVNEDGTFPSVGETHLAFQNYLRNHPVSGQVRTASWTSLGPTSSEGGYAGIGRMASIAFHPSDTNKIYVGTAGGGLWQTNDGGNNWFTNTDAMSTLGISSIVINPNNPLEIYIATGDSDGGDNYSVGILKSTDGGNIFTPTGLSWNLNQQVIISKILIDSDNNSALLAATSDGIYRSLDAGVNWTQEIAGNFRDIEAHPTASTNTFYASLGSSIFKSTDNGDTWISVQTISNTNRIALGVSPANPSYVYALCSRSNNNGYRAMYRSTNSGTSFTSMSTTPNLLGWAEQGNDSGGQGWYDLTIAVDPVDANIVYTGGVNCWKSTNGGANWTIKSIWSSNGSIAEVHADKHAMEWQGNKLWEGNDGGIYYTVDGGNTWQYKSVGIINSQMYKLGVSEMDDKVMTGLQDNGSKLYADGIWDDVIGGDGMECAIQQNDGNVTYGSIYYGNFNRSSNEGISWSNISDNIPGQPAGAWITPFVIDPSLPHAIYTGYKLVYKSYDQGNTWDTIGNFAPSNLDFVVVAPSNSDFVYAGLSNGSIWKTMNGGSTWSSITNPGNNVTMLAIHPTNPNHIYVTRSHYSAAGKVFKSLDGGGTWTDISGSLPAIPANCIVYQNGSSDGLYVGMDIGVYYRENSMEDWTLYNSSLPNAVISELEIDYDESKIYAATYGRGLWKSDLFTNITCYKPKGVKTVNVTNFTADLTWQTPSVPPINGYEYAIQLSPTNLPVTGTATSSLVASFTGLTPSTPYYFYVRSVCGTVRSPWVIYGPITTEDLCPKPNNVVQTAIGPTNSGFAWSSIYIPSNGYQYGITTTPAPPASGIPVSSQNVSITGLTSATKYYFHVRLDCGADGYSNWVSKEFFTSYTCGQTFYDTGGSATNYNNNEDIVRTICPSAVGEVVTLTLSAFGVEEGWDALYLHDGNTTDAPIFNSGNPATDAGFPAGGYYGATIPSPFIADNSSGCLTSHFLSDGFVTELGWASSVTCTNVCSTVINNNRDDGAGSLRFNLNCNVAGSTLTFSPALINDTIVLNSASILIDKNITLSNTTGGNIFIKSPYSVHAITINAGVTANILNLNIIGKNNGSGAKAISNYGICNLIQVKLYSNNSSGSGGLIENKGVLNVNGVVELKN